MTTTLLRELRRQLSSRDRAILSDLERFRLLTSRHLQQLHFTDHRSELAATRASNRSLQRLRQLGLIAALDRRIGGVRRGSASYVWQLTSRGDRVLAGLQSPTQRRRFHEPGGLFVDHTLAVANVAIDLIVGLRAGQDADLLALSVEPANWRPFLGAGGETRWLRPDLHVVTYQRENGAEYEAHAFVEIDLGSEHLPRIRAKCEVYAAYAASGAYQAEHGLFPAVVWLSRDPARRRALRAATAASSGLPAKAFQVADPRAWTGRLVGREPPAGKEGI